MDCYSSEKRSWNMSKIRSRDTKLEIVIRSFLHNNGYRFRLHQKDLPGTPDIVLKKYKSIIFCNGFFWHQHPNCNRARIPKTNISFWLPKLEKNVEIFNKNMNELQRLVWHVLVIWNCNKNIDTELKLSSILHLQKFNRRFVS